MHFFFAYYPYICITLLLAGLAFRYVTDPGDWNARSSEIFEKTWLRRGSIIFHYAIILSFFGHIVGLLTPDSVMHALRISMEAHTVVAVGMGMILAPLVVVGLGILLWRSRICRCWPIRCPPLRTTSLSGRWLWASACFWSSPCCVSCWVSSCGGC